ncbi:ABC transporter permease, partial [Salmonella enterica subsp. enterica]|nr:ABC transporter permease [Salmonella enterica subsp. enterica]
MSRMNKMGTVVGFTFMNKVRTKSFIITTLVLALLVTIGLHVPYFIDKFTGGDDQPSKIGLVYEGQPELAKSLEAYTEKQQAAGYTLVPYEQADKAKLQAAIDAGEIDGYLQFAEGDDGVFPAVTYTSKKDSLGMGLQTALQAALQNVKAGYLTKGMLTDEQIAALSAPVQIDAVKASPESGGSETGNKSEE